MVRQPSVRRWATTHRGRLELSTKTGSDGVAWPAEQGYRAGRLPLGNSLTVELPTLTRAVLVRIQVPQPFGRKCLISQFKLAVATTRCREVANCDTKLGHKRSRRFATKHISAHRSARGRAPDPP